jgi:molybdenum cofactor cytidylyltransferase
MNRSPSVHAIVLAAGNSMRMGEPKQLLHMGDDTLLNHCLKQVYDAPFSELTVVLGGSSDLILPTLPKYANLRVFINPHYQEGLGNSISSSLRYILKSGCPDAIMLILADQPLLKTEHLMHLLDACGGENQEILVSSYGNGVFGPPVLMTRHFYEQLCNLQGDNGAKSIISRNPEYCRKIDLETFDPIDVDTPQLYKEALKKIS